MGQCYVKCCSLASEEGWAGTLVPQVLPPPTPRPSHSTVGKCGRSRKPDPAEVSGQAQLCSDQAEKEGHLPVLQPGVCVWGGGGSLFALHSSGSFRRLAALKEIAFHCGLINAWDINVGTVAVGFWWLTRLQLTTLAQDLKGGKAIAIILQLISGQCTQLL